MFILGRFEITHHAYEQYDHRVKIKGKGTVKKSINHDLRAMNIRNIVRFVKDGEKKIHVFTRNCKEFCFVEGEMNDRGNKLYLRTVIKRNIEDTKKVLEKKKALVSC